MSKLDGMEVEMMEERLTALTHLSQTQQRRLDSLTQEMATKDQELGAVEEQKRRLEVAIGRKEEQMAIQGETIQQLTVALREKEMEIMELGASEQDVMQVASDAEIGLKREISQLEHEKSELREKVRECQRRLESEGITLQHEEAAELQGIIESQQHTHRLELDDLNAKYEKVIVLYKQELAELNSQLA